MVAFFELAIVCNGIKSIYMTPRLKWNNTAYMALGIESNAVYALLGYLKITLIYKTLL